MYITIKLTDNSVRAYNTIEKATEHSVKINIREDNHPSFHLYKLNGKNKAKFMGRLSRLFGHDELFWDEKADEVFVRW